MNLRYLIAFMRPSGPKTEYRNTLEQCCEAGLTAEVSGVGQPLFIAYRGQLLWEWVDQKMTFREFAQQSGVIK